MPKQSKEKKIPEINEILNEIKESLSENVTRIVETLDEIKDSISELSQIRATLQYFTIAYITANNDKIGSEARTLIYNINTV